MQSIRVLLILCILFQFNQVIRTSNNNMCDYEDKKCLRRGANNFYKVVVPGVPGVMPPSDPLYLDEITGKMQCVNYRLTNFTLTGMKNCTVTYSEVRKVKLRYKHVVSCPKLILNYDYVYKGKLGPVYMDSKGVATLTAIDYVITFIGNYGEFVCEKNHKPHFYIKNNRIETDPRGKLFLEATSLHKSKEKSEEALAYINENWKTLEKYLRCPIMTDCMALFIENLDALIKTVPEDVVFPKHSCKMCHE